MTLELVSEQPNNCRAHAPSPAQSLVLPQKRADLPSTLRAARMNDRWLGLRKGQAQLIAPAFAAVFEAA